VGLVEQVAVLSGLYCDNAKNLGGQHARMASRWGSCGTPIEMGQADHLQLVLDQSQLEASVASGAYLYYWQRKDTDAYDHTLSEVLGNGLTNDYSHNAATGRPDIISTRDGKQSIRELHYRYDDNNNVTYRNDLQLGITDTWKYDSLDRVTNNSIALRDKNRHGVNNPDLKQAFTYQYDKIGNIKLKTGVGSYSYSGVNAGPHAVTKAGSLNYQYDSVGNLIRTKRDGSNASQRTLTWTEFNKPASITRNGQRVEFYYDANHNRYLKKSSDGSETFYFGKTYERIKASDGEVQHKHFVYADGKLIALNTQTRDSDNKLKNKQVRYLHYDALNSVDMITDGYGNVVERRSYDTWGKQRTVSWRSDNITEVIQSAITNRGYTGHEQIEEVGLIHMNGRVYDADLGRFLSADPVIQAPYIIGSLNRYSYVWNNPLKYTDPTGFRLVEDDPNGNYQAPDTGSDEPDNDRFNGRDSESSGHEVGEAEQTQPSESLSSDDSQKEEEEEDYGFSDFLFDTLPFGNTLEHLIDGDIDGAKEALAADAVDFAKDVALGVVTGGVGLAVTRGAKIAKAARKAGVFCSFVSGTLVATSVGAVPIELISEDQQVVSLPDTAQYTLDDRNVIGIFSEYHPFLLRLIIDGPSGKEEILTTPEHPFFVPSAGWVDAADLKVGENLSTIDSQPIELLSNDVVRQPAVAYNFEVEEFHTYAVGKNQVWVHNRCKDKAKKKANTADVGDVVETPDSHPEKFTDLPGSQGKKNKKTKEIWKDSKTNHSHDPVGEYKVGIGRNPPQPGQKITVTKSNNKVYKKDDL